MMARAGSESTFKEGRDDLKQDSDAGIEVSAKDVERVAESLGRRWRPGQKKNGKQLALKPCAPPEDKALPLLYIAYDGTGVPMTKAELAGRREGRTGSYPEAKLGCVFTQTRTDAKGFPVRDPDSTTFVGAIETAETFGERIYGEAVRRGLLCANRVVVLGDGAEWIRNLADLHFPQATLIIDLYHAREHVSQLCKSLFGTDEKQIRQQRIRWRTYLDQGNVEKILSRRNGTFPRARKHKRKPKRNFITWRKTRTACGMPSSGPRVSLWVPVL